MKPLPPHGRVSRTAAAVLSAATIVALSGCSGSDAGSAENLTLWISSSAEQQAGYDTIVEQYKDETGVTVEIVNLPYDGYTTRLRSAAQANALPDLASVPALDPIWTDALVDLDGIASNPDYSIDESVVAKDDDGKVLTIPTDVTASGMFINKSLFDAAGVSYPTDPEQTWTWDEFIEATTAVREGTEAQYNLVFDGSPSRLRALQYQMGGNAIQADDNGVFSTNDKTEGIYNYFKSLNDDVVIPKSVWTSGADPNALFKSGQVAAYFSGVWQIADFTSTITDFEWAAVPAPAQPVHATDLNFGGLAVAFENSDERGQAAYDFLDWMYTPENYKVLVEANGFLPVETGLDVSYPFESETAIAGFDLYNKEIALADPISASFGLAQIKWALNGKSLSDDPTVAQMGAFINDQQDAETTLENIIAGYNDQVGGE